jgi:hypothetical protein
MGEDMELGPRQKSLLAALRSGEHKQGKRRLHGEDDRLCCLGVVCKLAVQDGLPVRVTRQDGGCLYDGSYTFLPVSVQAWICMRTSSGSWGILCSLANSNDYGKTFAEIADIIEAHADEIFTGPA